MDKKTKKEMSAVDLDMKLDKGLHPIPGQFYSFVTVAPLFHGRLLVQTTDEYHLADACWVPETGRVNEFAKDPAIAVEVEEIGDLVIPKGAVVGFWPSGDKRLKTK